MDAIRFEENSILNGKHDLGKLNVFLETRHRLRYFNLVL